MKSNFFKNREIRFITKFYEKKTKNQLKVWMPGVPRVSTSQHQSNTFEGSFECWVGPAHFRLSFSHPNKVCKNVVEYNIKNIVFIFQQR